MKYFLALCVFCAFAFFGNKAFGHISKYGHVHTVGREIKTYLNAGCEKTDSCSLKRFSLIINKYENWYAEENKAGDLGTESIAEYETAAVNDLEQYLIVQFIRGCVFSSYIDKGQKSEIFGTKVTHFDKDAYLCFPEWVIDSFSKNPALYGEPDQPIYYYYQWNRNPDSYDSKTAEFYGEEKPLRPVLYTIDLPTRAAYFLGEATNVSLEFKSCIYKAKDVPKKTEDNDLSFAQPIKCLEWQISYIYNFEKKIFESKPGIYPFCLQKPPEIEENKKTP